MMLLINCRNSIRYNSKLFFQAGFHCNNISFGVLHCYFVKGLVIYENPLFPVLLQRLADLSTSPTPRLIDGILLTKFDTIDDKVNKHFDTYQKVKKKNQLWLSVWQFNPLVFRNLQK